MEQDFDRYEERYDELVARSIAFSGRGHAFFVEAKARHLLDVVRRHLGDPASLALLDVGCGHGLVHRHLGAFGRVEGVDASPAMIERARLGNPAIRYTTGDATSLPFDAGVFDVVFAVGLLHHLEPGLRDESLREMRRVARPGGLVVLFEHNPLNPLTRLAVERCEFDEGVVLLGPREVVRRAHAAGLAPVERRYILFFPWDVSLLRGFERALRRLPFGAQYYVAAHA